MSEQLLDLLKLCTLALLYLFFLRVMWAVWSELRAPKQRRAATATAAPAAMAAAPAAAPRAAGAKRGKRGRSSRNQPAVLRVTAPPELVGVEYPLAPEMTMGRAPGCTIVVDDTYVSQLHARVFADDQGYHVEDLGSTNGTYHNGEILRVPHPLKRGDQVRVGSTVLELT